MEGDTKGVVALIVVLIVLGALQMNQLVRDSAAAEQAVVEVSHFSSNEQDTEDTQASAREQVASVYQTIDELDARFEEVIEKCQGDPDCELAQGFDQLFQDLRSLYLEEGEGPDELATSLFIRRPSALRIYHDVLGVSEAQESEDGAKKSFETRISPEARLQYKRHMVEFNKILEAEMQEVYLLQTGVLEGAPVTLAGRAWVSVSDNPDFQKQIGDFVRDRLARGLLVPAMYFLEQDLK